MKKVLLTTSILAFAGSAFAADVSGYVISAYKNVKGSATASENGKSQFTETEIYLSGSKTASNGLTFGANYTIGWDGDNAKRSGAYSVTNYSGTTIPDPSSNIADASALNNDTGKKEVLDAILAVRSNGRGLRMTKAAVTSLAGSTIASTSDFAGMANTLTTDDSDNLMSGATDGYGGALVVTAMAGEPDTASNLNTFIKALALVAAPANIVTNSEPIPHEVSSFVSGSFGKLTMGAHAFASKSHGVSALSVGNGINNDITAVAGHYDSKKGLTYETPVFNGLSAAYTMEFGTNSARSYAIHYSAQYAGIGLKAAYGSFKQGLGNDTRNGYDQDVARDNSWGVQVSKGPFAVSYARGTDKTTRNYIAGDIDSDADKEQTRWGVSYNAGKVSVGYSRLYEEQAVGYSAGTNGGVYATAATKETSSVISVSYAVASGLDVFMEQQKVGRVKTQLIGTNISF